MALGQIRGSLVGVFIRLRRLRDAAVTNVSGPRTYGGFKIQMVNVEGRGRYFVGESPKFKVRFTNSEPRLRNATFVIDFRVGGTDGARFPIIFPLEAFQPLSVFEPNLVGPPLTAEGLATYRLVHYLEPEEAACRSTEHLVAHLDGAPYELLASFKVYDRDTFIDERRRTLLYWIGGAAIGIAAIVVAVLTAAGRL